MTIVTRPIRGVLPVLLTLLCGACGGESAEPTPKEPSPQPTLTPGIPSTEGRPDLSGMTDEEVEKARVTIVTNFGEMTFRMRPDKAPYTSRHFLHLAREGFYEGLGFHRVMRDFMIQGGCPNSREGAGGVPGTGDPGYSIPAEFNDLDHGRGVISMARSSSPDSAGCQFFVVTRDSLQNSSSLNGNYTAFGQMLSGGDVLDRIAAVRVARSPFGGSEASSPQEPIRIERVVVN